MHDFDAVAHQWARGVIRSAMVKRSITFGQLAELLRTIGLDEDERALRNKVARGTFSAAFFGECLAVMGVRTLAIDLFDTIREESKQPKEPTMEEILDAIRKISGRE